MYLEKAFEGIHVDRSVVDQTPDGEGHRIFKPHGSLDRPESIAITIDRILRRLKGSARRTFEAMTRGRRIANAILLDPFEADEAVANALIQTERVPYVPENFGAYFDQVVRHAACDIQRRHSRQPPMASLDDIALHFDLYYDSPSPEEELIGGETGQMVRSALAELAPEEQNAVILHHVEGLSIPETARVLGLTVYRTQNVLVRARRKLREILAPRLARCGPAPEKRCARHCLASA